MNQWWNSYRRNHSAATFGRKVASVFSSMAALVAVLSVFAPSASAVGAVRKQADFNGDGYADLAIGAPGESYTYYVLGRTISVTQAGVVHVIYGSTSGLSYGRNQLLSRDPKGRRATNRPANYAAFGRALAWGDFNKDGYDDLAISVFGGSGSVDVYYGSANGLGSFASQTLTHSQIPNSLPSNPGDSFSSAMAVGDINGDGYADLTISQVTSSTGRGACYVIYGTANGLNPANGQMLYYFAGMGPTALTTGDFNGDGFFDLAMGMPYDWVGKVAAAGRVMVAYGTPYGLDSNPQIWTQDSPDIAGICEQYDYFGYALTSADFNDDGKWDLVIGSPGENSNSGIVQIIFGQSSGLDSWASQIWSQDNPNVYETSEAGDRFGESLAAMHMEYDRFPELVVGIPGENSGAGAVQVLTIVPGYLGIRHAYWTQDSYEILGMCEAGDRFGSALSFGDFNGDSYPDLAVGARGENSNTGAVNVIYRAGSGLSWRGNELIMQGYEGLAETQEPGDFFGTL